MLLALLPAFLLAWGAELYEQWILLSAAAAFIALADLGTRPYLHNKMLLNYAAGEREYEWRVRNNLRETRSAAELFASRASSIVRPEVIITSLCAFQSESSRSSGADGTTSMASRIASSRASGLARTSTSRSPRAASAAASR